MMMQSVNREKQNDGGVAASRPSPLPTMDCEVARRLCRSAQLQDAPRSIARTRSDALTESELAIIILDPRARGGPPPKTLQSSWRVTTLCTFYKSYKNKMQTNSSQKTTTPICCWRIEDSSEIKSERAS